MRPAELAKPGPARHHLPMLRLHGPSERYAGAYGHEGLRPWAERIRAWALGGREVWVFFDNDIGGAAPQDAFALRSLLD